MEWRELSLPPYSEGISGYDIGKSLYFYTGSTELAHEVGERPLQLHIQFPTKGDGPAEAMNLLASLEAHALTPAPHALQEMNLNSVGAKKEWATYSFGAWANSLSTEESRSLSKLGGPEYREINGYLRRPHLQPDPRMSAVIANADSAIAKGVVNREITTYRYDSSLRLFEIWDKLSKSRNTNGFGIPLHTEPGYGFTTIDPAVASCWNKSQLGGKGILLEIEVPKGTPAAFLDSPGIFNNRGYLELVLKRGSQYEVIGFRENSDGQKILKVRYRSK